MDKNNRTKLNTVQVNRQKSTRNKSIGSLTLFIVKIETKIPSCIGIVYYATTTTPYNIRMNEQIFAQKYFSVPCFHAKIKLMVDVFIMFEWIRSQRDLSKLGGQVHGSIRKRRDSEMILFRFDWQKVECIQSRDPRNEEETRPNKFLQIEIRWTWAKRLETTVIYRKRRRRCRHKE